MSPEEDTPPSVRGGCLTQGPHRPCPVGTAGEDARPTHCSAWRWRGPARGRALALGPRLRCPQTAAAGLSQLLEVSQWSRRAHHKPAVVQSSQWPEPTVWSWVPARHTSSLWAGSAEMSDFNSRQDPASERSAPKPVNKHPGGRSPDLKKVTPAPTPTRELSKLLPLRLPGLPAPPLPSSRCQTSPARAGVCGLPLVSTIETVAMNK